MDFPKISILPCRQKKAAAKASAKSANPLLYAPLRPEAHGK